MGTPTTTQITSALLSDITGRDKIMRSCSFAAGFLATFADQKNAQKFRTVQGQISSCRVVFRLFGDLPMWIRAKRSKWGKTAVVSETSKPISFMETVSTLNVAADLLYMPVEHIAWAAQNGLVPVSAGKWWTGTMTVWAVSLTLAIYRAMSNLLVLKRKLLHLQNKRDDGVREERKALRRRIITEQLNVLRSSADLMCAVNALPKGFLWSQRMSVRWHCLFGVIASFASLIQAKRDLFP